MNSDSTWYRHRKGGCVSGTWEPPALGTLGVGDRYQIMFSRESSKAAHVGSENHR
ncbi:MAG: hypothetical protein MI923_12420 [Phycisphaerales bacterium]|nr:hypothetical protein [Phycisphaerales bacterium]